MTPARWLALFFALYYFGYGTFLPYWALWLGDAGAGAGLVGLLLGLGMAVRCAGILGIMGRVCSPPRDLLNGTARIVKNSLLIIKLRGVNRVMSVAYTSKAYA